MKFKGKVSWWFYALVIGIAAVLIPITVPAIADRNVLVVIGNALVFLSLESFCVPIVFHNFAELQDETLLIQFGLIKRIIPYSEVTAVSPTSNPLSSLAASLDRIEIKCRGGADVMISLVEKERFLAEIAKRIPNVTVM